MGCRNSAVNPAANKILGNENEVISINALFGQLVPHTLPEFSSFLNQVMLQIWHQEATVTQFCCNLLLKCRSSLTSNDECYSTLYADTQTQTDRQTDRHTVRIVPAVVGTNLHQLLQPNI